MNYLKKFLKASFEIKLFILAVIFFALATVGTVAYAYLRLPDVRSGQGVVMTLQSP